MRKNNGQGQKLEKRLVLGKETLRRLNDSELQKADGAHRTTASGCLSVDCCEYT
jgi:hypothetical protein